MLPSWCRQDVLQLLKPSIRGPLPEEAQAFEVSELLRDWLVCGDPILAAGALEFVLNRESSSDIVDEWCAQSQGGRAYAQYP